MDLIFVNYKTSNSSLGKTFSKQQELWKLSLNNCKLEIERMEFLTKEDTTLNGQPKSQSGSMLNQIQLIKIESFDTEIPQNVKAVMNKTLKIKY